MRLLSQLSDLRNGSSPVDRVRVRLYKVLRIDTSILSSPHGFLDVPSRSVLLCGLVTPHCTSLFEYVSLAVGASSSLVISCSLIKVIQHQHQQEGDEHNSSLILTDAFAHSFINVHEAVQ